MSDRLVMIRLSILLFFILSACTGRAALPTPTSSTETSTTPLPSTGYVDACALVSAGEASRVTGVSFDRPAYSSQMHPGEPFTECQYLSGTRQVRVSAFRYAGPSTAIDALKAQASLWQGESGFALIPGLGDLGFQNRNGAYFVKDYYVVDVLVFYDTDLTAQANRDMAISLAQIAASRLR